MLLMARVHHMDHDQLLAVFTNIFTALICLLAY